MNKRSLIYRTLFLSVTLILLCGTSLSVNAKTEEGLNALSIGEYEKAEAFFRDVIKGDAEDAEAGYYLGISLLMQEKYKEALDIFTGVKKGINKKAVKEDTQNTAMARIEIGLARSYLGIKNYPEAFKSLSEAEKAKGDPIDIHTFKGAYYLELNENIKANEELKKALEMNSQNPYTYYYAGIVNIRLGHPQDAVKMFEVFLNMAPYTHEAEHAKFLVDTLC